MMLKNFLVGILLYVSNYYVVHFLLLNGKGAVKMNVIKILLSAMLFSMMSCVTVLADLYPEYLYGNPAYPMVAGRMDYATYLDKSSVVLKYQSEDQGMVWAQYEIDVGFKYDSATRTEHLNKVKTPVIYWYYFPENPNNLDYSIAIIDGRSYVLPPFRENTAYYSRDFGRTWNSFSLDYQSQSEHRTYRAFWMGFNALK